MVVDANVLNFVYALDLWEAMTSLLRKCEIVLRTIDTVYRREIVDSVRELVEELQEEGLLSVEQNPYQRTNLSRKARKDLKKVKRWTKDRPTSRCDDQLLFEATSNETPLVTCENALRELANKHGVDCFDLLDLVDALVLNEHIDTHERNTRVFMNWPEEPGPSTLDLVTESDDRGGYERFDCGQ